MKKHILFGIFGILLILTFTTCDNDNGNGDKTIAISTADGLNRIRENLSGDYVLVGNINLSAAQWSNNAGWQPIGTEKDPFTGTFNGGRSRIVGLRINSDEDFVGLFGYIKDATISNIILDNVNITGKDNVGAIVGAAHNSSITNSFSRGNITAVNRAGGIAGSMGDNSSITNSHSHNNVRANNSWAGGIAGSVVSSSITNSHSRSGVRAEINGAGGIAGQVSGNSTITNNAAINPMVRAGTASAGRVLGEVSGGTISNNFASQNMNPPGTGGVAFTENPQNHGISKSITELGRRSTFSNSAANDGLGWSFGSNNNRPWKWQGPVNNGGPPVLHWQ